MLRRVYSGSSPSSSRESEKCKAFLPALGSFQAVGFGPRALEPAGRSRKNSAIDQPQGREAAPVVSSGCQERAGEGKDLRLGLLRG